MSRRRKRARSLILIVLLSGWGCTERHEGRPVSTSEPPATVVAPEAPGHLGDEHRCPGNEPTAAQRLVGTWEIDVEGWAGLPHVRDLPQEGKARALRQVRHMASEMTFEYTRDTLIIREGAKSKTEDYRIIRDGCDSCEVATASSKSTTSIRVVEGGLVVGLGNGAFALRRKAATGP